jgi:hypothetical protein
MPGGREHGHVDADLSDHDFGGEARDAGHRRDERVVGLKAALERLGERGDPECCGRA